MRSTTIMPPLLRSHDRGSTHHGSRTALRADPHQTTRAFARQLLILHPELLTDDLLELHPAPFAHAWPRTQHSAAPSSPLRPAAMPAPLTPSSPLPAAGPSKPLCACHKTSTPQPHDRFRLIEIP